MHVASVPQNKNRLCWSRSLLCAHTSQRINTPSSWSCSWRHDFVFVTYILFNFLLYINVLALQVLYSHISYLFHIKQCVLVILWYNVGFILSTAVYIIFVLNCMSLLYFTMFLLIFCYALMCQHFKSYAIIYCTF